MGLLNFLGLDDLADSVNELTTGLDELRSDIVGSIVEPAEDVKNTITDISETIQGK